MPLPNPTIDEMEVSITAAVTVMDGAEQLINGFSGRVETAVATALANSVSAEELAQAVRDELDAIKAKTTSLAAAVQANTPAQP